MANAAGRALKAALLAEYGHFSDKRIKNLDKGSLFIVDDRTEGGLASDGKPFGWFCEIHVNVIDDDQLQVTLGGQVPLGRTVGAWIGINDAKMGESWGRDWLKFMVRVSEPQKLATLAEAFAAIVKPPARYSERSYKYSCARLYGSLLRLHDTLTRFNNREANPG